MTDQHVPAAAVNIDPAHVDAALSTTRAVRRRLDLGREVDNQILLDCIDVAEQAPSGGNLGSRRWIIVRDPAVKAALAELYNRRAGPLMAATAERLAGTGHPQEKVMASAAYLAEHLAEVPALVIVTIIGRHDGSGRPGLFDSVIQAAWSFCVALRARGLGSSWVTAIFSDEARVKELLGIPDDHTEIVMFPVAWTKGTQFRPVARHPARSITYFDVYGSTFEAGPQPRIRFADGPGVLVETDIKAPVTAVWPLVTDVNVPAAYSSEFLGAQWEGEDRGAGATFLAWNNHPAIGEYEMRCWIDALEENRTFGWRTADPGQPGARWRFDLEQIPGRTRLRFSVMMGPGPSGTSMAIASMPAKEDRIVLRRIRELRANMRATVEGIRQLAEGGNPPQEQPRPPRAGPGLNEPPS
jgi:nitroreductase